MCNAHHSVRTKVKGPLSKECKGAGKKGGSGLRLRPGFPVLRVLLLYLLHLYQGPSTSIPPLFAARDSQPRHGPEEPIAGPYGPELPRPKLIPSKPKCKAKSQVQSQNWSWTSECSMFL